MIKKITLTLLILPVSIILYPLALFACVIVPFTIHLQSAIRKYNQWDTVDLEIFRFLVFLPYSATKYVWSK